METPQQQPTTPTTMLDDTLLHCHVGSNLNATPETASKSIPVFSIKPLECDPIPEQRRARSLVIGELFQECFYCKMAMSLESKDIYMYRDHAFCSVGCRRKQEFIDALNAQ